MTKTSRVAIGSLLAMLMLAGCATPKPDDGQIPCRVFGRMTTCAAVPLATDAADRAAKAFEPPSAGMARLYLMRPWKQEWKTRTRVYLDGKPLGALGPATYAVIDVRPGPHRIVFDGGEHIGLPLMAEPGKLYFGLYEARLWLWRFERGARWISRADAAEVVNSSRRVDWAKLSSPPK